jgi:hypothetical protein
VFDELGPAEAEVGEAAGLLGLSVRSVWHLKRRFADEGPAGSVQFLRVWAPLAGR